MKKALEQFKVDHQVALEMPDDDSRQKQREAFDFCRDRIDRGSSARLRLGAMAVEFLVEAKARLPGQCDAAFDGAIGHYSTVRDKLRALSELHPERPGGWDWTTTIASPERAQLVREAAQAERQGVACSKQIAKAL